MELPKMKVYVHGKKDNGFEPLKGLFCECYCKFPEEYYGMYKDVDEAQGNLEREKCDMCPIEQMVDALWKGETK